MNMLVAMDVPPPYPLAIWHSYGNHDFYIDKSPIITINGYKWAMFRSYVKDGIYENHSFDPPKYTKRAPGAMLKHWRHVGHRPIPSPWAQMISWVMKILRHWWEVHGGLTRKLLGNELMLQLFMGSSCGFMGVQWKSNGECMGTLWDEYRTFDKKHTTEEKHGFS